MSIHRTSSTLALALLALAGCTPTDEAGPVEPSPGAAVDEVASLAAHRPGHGPPPGHHLAGGLANATVMTRNLYLGADINRVMNPPEIPGLPGDVALAVTADALWEMVQATDFAERARALAAEIAAIRPDAVALQEASLFRLGPGRSCAGDPTPPDEVALDFLAMLGDELAARGHPYDVASTVENFDGTLCALKLDATGQVVRALDVRLTDRDAVLVRAGLPTEDPRHGNYLARVTFPVPSVPGLEITITRGWASAAVKVRGEWLRFVATHLEQEQGLLGQVQALQAEELIALVADEPLPLVVAGDFNAFAGSELTPTHAMLAAAGLRDVWQVVRPGAAGPTCCFAEDLGGGTLTTRIDQVWVRGRVLPLAAARTGVAGFTPSGIHPSDHAGVAARLLLPDPPPHGGHGHGPGPGNGHDRGHVEGHGGSR